MIDTHIFGFLMGGILAVWEYLKRDVVRRKYSIEVVKIMTGMAVIGVLSFKLVFYLMETFIFGLILVAFSIVLIMSGVLGIQTALNDKKIKPLNITEWLGGLSFGLYLFHYPLMVFLPSIMENQSQWIVVGVNVLVSVVMAVLINMFIKKFKSEKRELSWLILMFLGGAAILIFINAWSRIPISSEITNQLEGQKRESGEISQVEVKYLNNNEIANMEDLKKLIKSIEDKSPAPKSEGSSASNVNSAKVLVIGDSVTLGAKADLEMRIPEVYVDAMESRGIEAARVLLARYMASGRLPKVIVVSLATNERRITEEVLDNIVKLVGPDHKFVFVTAYAGPLQPRDRQNSALKQFAESRENVSIADWWSVSHNNWGLMYADHIHLNPDGRRIYAELIWKVVNNF